MRAELDIFSGRPNPVWELDPAKARELLELEHGLSLAGRRAIAPPPLGYRGLIYGDGGERRRVYEGILNKSGRDYEDRNRRIERLLVGTLPSEFRGLRQYLPRELD